MRTTRGSPPKALARAADMASRSAARPNIGSARAMSAIVLAWTNGVEPAGQLRQS
jgi:hypothetical protein